MSNRTLVMMIYFFRSRLVPAMGSKYAGDVVLVMQLDIVACLLDL